MVWHGYWIILKERAYTCSQVHLIDSFKKYMAKKQKPMKWSISIYIYIYICQFTGRLVNSPLIRIVCQTGTTLTIITIAHQQTHVWFFNLAQHCNHHPTISILFGGGIILGLPGLPNCINLLIIVNHKPHQHQKMQTLQFWDIAWFTNWKPFFASSPNSLQYQPTNPTQPNPTQPTTNIFLAPFRYS